MSGVRWEGMDRLERVFAELPKVAARELAAALVQEAEQVMTRSKRDFVPVDLGVLRASGHVAPPDIRGDRVTVTLGYGGAAAAYALIQHERLDFNHPRGGQAKYLEQPVLEAAAGLGGRLARRIDMKRGI